MPLSLRPRAADPAGAPAPDDAEARRGLRLFRRRAEATAESPSRMRALARRAQGKLAGQREQIGTLRDDVPVLLRLVRAYARGDYRRLPWRSLTMIVGGLLYFVAPLDLIPDVILGTGFLDDAAVVAFVLRSLRGDLDRFAEWEEHGSDLGGRLIKAAEKRPESHPPAD